jgi:hypothetical protein
MSSCLRPCRGIRVTIAGEILNQPRLSSAADIQFPLNDDASDRSMYSTAACTGVNPMCRHRLSSSREIARRCAPNVTPLPPKQGRLRLPESRAATQWLPSFCVIELCGRPFVLLRPAKSVSVREQQARILRMGGDEFVIECSRLG